MSDKTESWALVGIYLRRQGEQIELVSEFQDGSEYIAAIFDNEDLAVRFMVEKMVAAGIGIERIGQELARGVTEAEAPDPPEEP